MSKVLCYHDSISVDVLARVSLAQYSINVWLVGGACYLWTKNLRTGPAFSRAGSYLPHPYTVNQSRNINCYSL